jgi:predicted alpha/beta-fold hydrolase
MIETNPLYAGTRLPLLSAIRGHAQTLLPYFFHRVNLPKARRIEIPLRDGDFVDADLRMSDSKGLAILSHGLEGNSDSVYIRSITRSYLSKGWDVLAWNFRGCSGRLNRLQRLYHSGAIEDLQDVVAYASENLQASRIQLTGFSLGGNLTLLCIGKKSDWLIEKGVVSCLAVSVPLNLAASSRKLNRWWNAMYQQRFLSDLKNKILFKEKQFPGHYPISGIRQTKTLAEFDNQCTAPLHGFRGADDYYQKCSSLHVLSDIRIPTLIIIAKNDPMLARGNYAEAMEMNKRVRFILTDEGGHCGFRGMGFW